MAGYFLKAFANLHIVFVRQARGNPVHVDRQAARLGFDAFGFGAKVTQRIQTVQKCGIQPNVHHLVGRQRKQLRQGHLANAQRPILQLTQQGVHLPNGSLIVTLIDDARVLNEVQALQSQRFKARVCRADQLGANGFWHDRFKMTEGRRVARHQNLQARYPRLPDLQLGF